MSLLLAKVKAALPGSVKSALRRILAVQSGRPQSSSSSAPLGGPSRELAKDATFEDIFDRQWYLETYGDVANAGADPLQHFIAFGEAEGRNPNPLFSTRIYREAYMRNEPPGASPLRHYLEFGRNLGFDANPKGVAQYRRFVERWEQKYGLELPELRQHVSLMSLRPLVVIYAPGTDKVVQTKLREHLGRQIYERWVLCADIGAVRDAVSGLKGTDWGLVWLAPGDMLHSAALYAYVSRFNEQPSAALIYADEDEIDDRGERSRPFVKPDWSPDYLEAFNYVGPGAYISGEAASSFENAAGVYDLLLRATEGEVRVEHVKQFLVHRSRGLDAPTSAEDAARDMAALDGRLRRTARQGGVSQVQEPLPYYDARPQLAEGPLVSVIIPTAGRVANIDGRSVDLLGNCIGQLTAVSTYKALEIIVIHNGDLGAERIADLEARGIILISYDGEFNVARKLNMGAGVARGELLLLLNDDVEPLTPDWIERMVEHFEKPAVGIVGPKLLFPAMVIQHAGVVMPKAKPDHLRFKYPRDDLGYFFSTCAVRNFSAVTGAVMMTRASLYKELGGYTEALPVNFNDVDYCLKSMRAGYRTVYTPRAELIHYESMSRPREVKSFEVEFIENEWRYFVTDPFYNEAMLTSSNPNYDFVGERDPIG